MRDLLKAFVLVFVIIGVLGFYGAWLGGQKYTSRQYYYCYAHLRNLLEGVETYKKQNGMWPAEMKQLVNFSLHLENDLQDGYGHAIILIPYSEKTGYGAVVSYGKDGKLGGDKKVDQDIELRFPTNTEVNVQWNKQVSERFKNRADRSLR